MLPLRFLGIPLLLLALPLPLFAQREFGFDNRKPSGQPYLPAEETVKRMKVADGFEVKLFAAEPMVVNPIAMTVDEKGRVWCIECFEYPKRTAKGKMPRDRIIILEDTDGDGVADKRTVFAEGKDFPMSFDMASGLEVGHGGVFVGAPPYLWFIENKNDRPGKFEVLLKGFGSEDTHETLNTFQWGPDGRLYGLHGVFTHSEVKPEQADGPATRLNAAVWRYDVRTRKFEVFAEGTSNPWGMDWRNTDGQFILCCCVIPHLFHIAPGGIYKRQAGASFNPYVYSYLNEICDHTFHRESGWAHAGLISLDTPIVPEQYRDSVIFGSIHGCSIKRNVLKKNGSTYTASRADDFLVSGDKNFRPINLRWGPNGEIYCIDWHDQNPCHQALPDSWDYERGRVYRIQPKGLKTKKAEGLGKRSSRDLLRLVTEAQNPWQIRTALRLFRERTSEARGDDAVLLYASGFMTLRDVWASHAIGVANRGAEESDLAELKKNKNPTVRSWLVRFLGESTKPSDRLVSALAEVAEHETSPDVRLQLASTARQIAGKKDVAALLHALMRHKEDARDPVIPQLVWLAFEQRLSSGARGELDWLKDNANGNALVSETIIPRTMRRLVATGKPEDLEACITFIRDLKDDQAKRQALEGLVLGLQGRQVDPPGSWADVQKTLLADGDEQVRRLTQRLAVTFRDAAAVKRAFAVVRDRRRPVEERAEAVRDLALLKPAEAQPLLLTLLRQEPSLPVRIEAARGLAAFDRRELSKEVLEGWKTYPPAVRGEAVNVLAGRREWARDLLAAVGNKRIPRTDLHDNVILRIRAFKDPGLNELIEKAWGTVRDTPAELNALIDKLRVQIDEGRPSFARGQKVFENNCAKCHKFEGKGHEVAPALDGAARDVEYLLANVIDPNRVVGQPYFTRLVTLKNGRVESGLLHAEDDQAVTLKGENDQLKVIPRNQIEEIQVAQKSVMPEGLANNMKPEEFRDLVRYLMANPFLTEVEVSAAGASVTRPVVGVTGRIPLPPMKGEAVATVRAEVIAPAALRTRLLLGADAAVEVRVNGRLVYSGQPGAGPDRAHTEVELREGKNEVVVKVTYRGDKASLYARFADPERKLRYPEPRE